MTKKIPKLHLFRDSQLTVVTRQRFWDWEVGSSTWDFNVWILSSTGMRWPYITANRDHFHSVISPFKYIWQEWITKFHCSSKEEQWSYMFTQCSRYIGANISLSSRIVSSSAHLFYRGITILRPISTHLDIYTDWRDTDTNRFTKRYTHREESGGYQSRKIR